MPICTPVSVPESGPWQAARIIIERLLAAGHETYAVGGCVRDLLLDQPVHDVDCCTAASPDTVAALFPRTLAVGKAFGVMIVQLPDGEQIEVASFRSDRAYVDGRHPQGVDPARVEEDVWRRDFTINALLLDLGRACVIDHIGGLADCRARCLRAVGNPAERLREDRLRILRGLRFAAHYALTIDPACWQAMEQGSLAGLSRERLHQEWRKGLSPSVGGLAWLQLLARSRHAAVVCPALVDAAPRVLPEAAEVATQVLLRSMWIWRDQPTAAFQAWIASLCWSKRERETLLAVHAAWQAWRRGEELTVCRCWQSPAGPLLETLQRTALQSGTVAGDPVLLDQYYQAVRARPTKALLNGRQLLTAGVAAGPAIGRCLEALRVAQSLGAVRDQAEAEAWLARWLTQSGLPPAAHDRPTGD